MEYRPMTELYVYFIFAFTVYFLFSLYIVFFSELGKRMQPWIRSNKSTALVIWALLFGVTLYGTTKSPFVWGQYIHDAGTSAEPRSWVTNDLVHIEWYAPTLPADDTVFVAYKELNGTNDWQDLEGVYWLIGDGMGEFTFANATNYQFFVYSEYIPPSPVVTNGVYHLSGFTDWQKERFAPIKVTVTATDEGGNTHRIAPINDNYELNAIIQAASNAVERANSKAQEDFDNALYNLIFED